MQAKSSMRNTPGHRWRSSVTVLLSILLLVLYCTRIPRDYPGSPGVLDADTLRVAFLGNSITPTSDAGDWESSTGLAASGPENDYVHILLARFQAHMAGAVSIETLRMSGYEAQFWTYDYAHLASCREFLPHLIVVRIGDNVDDAHAVDHHFWRAYGALLDSLEALDSGPTIICTSCWYPKNGIDAMMRAACQDRGVPFVDIGILYSVKKNRAESERPSLDDFAGSHPGDRGMREIAGALWSRIDPMLRTGSK